MLAAQELQVDINHHNRPVIEGLQPGYTPWSANASWFPGGDVIADRLGPLTVILRRIGSVGTVLQPGYWEEGVRSTLYDVRLVADGVKVNHGDGGAQIEMRLSGLGPGEHTLRTYHNDWDNHAPTAVAHGLYLGTDSNAVRMATISSPEYRGRLRASRYRMVPVNRLTTYYRRVDSVDPVGVVTRGSGWRFRARRLALRGAEGDRRFARGGWGGAVVKVPNLNDRGPGGLRVAIERDSSPRTIIFDVEGRITLESDLIIRSDRPHITVVGQTASGKGICLRKHRFGPNGARDLVVRFLRIRMGDVSGETQNATGIVGADHCIMDHCSISWGIDELLSTRGARNIMVQRTLIAEALNIAGHDKYPAGTRHGYAARGGGDTASLHHNLLACCEGRNRSLAGGLDGAGRFAGRLDLFNNVVYNWRSLTTDGGAHQVNFVNHFYQWGSASRHFFILSARYDTFPGTQQCFFVGNVMAGYYQTNQQDLARRATGYVPTNYGSWVAEPLFRSCAVADEATTAHKQVMLDVGCQLLRPDDQDARIIREVLDGTFTYRGRVSGDPGLPGSQVDVSGWEDDPFEGRPPDRDTDNEGLPNGWEEIHGLNPYCAPGDFSDAYGDVDDDEWTKLDEYLDWMARPNFCVTNGVPLEIDLTVFIRGVANHNPLYSVFDPVLGTVTWVDRALARCVSTVTTHAPGRFGFRVVDAQGHTMTNVIHLRLMVGVPRAAKPLRLGLQRSGGQTSLQVTGPAHRRVEIQQSPDLIRWHSWTGATLTPEGASVPVPVLASDGVRFCRAVVPSSE